MYPTGFRYQFHINTVPLADLLMIGMAECVSRGYRQGAVTGEMV